MLQDKSRKTSIIISSCLINAFYTIIGSLFFYNTYQQFELHYIIAPCCVFIILEILIFSLEGKLPKTSQLKKMIFPHLVMFCESSFLTLDLTGYLKVEKLQILIRISMILIQYMMITNILRFVQQGYQCNELLVLQILAKNSELVMYQSIVILLSGITQFILYGQNMYLGYLTLAVIFFLVVIVEQFVYGLQVYKVIGQNIYDL